ncbi:SNF2-related protein [Methanolobus bombayensis]|uniref:SNF2-related protein n=1 Tax=Methanolobus bombayensis TaxID=38023 RepID=UPI001AE0EB75|nr:SNF2-related protein [Methanolobus bombayensis]MBP1908315.1 ERCC4-related helicase [Methanolobus bombayensis]
MSNSDCFDGRSWRFLNDSQKYVDKWNSTEYKKLESESTKRQFFTASEILNRLNQQQGVILADDVGLGKTTVAALVAWVYAGKGKSVRILAPNEVMKRKWLEEIDNHKDVIDGCAKSLDFRHVKVHKEKLDKATFSGIYVSTHNNIIMNSESLKCNLLIIDEAHRAKSSESVFAQKLKKNIKNNQKVLFLTATPFSINLSELENILNLIGAKDIDTSFIENIEKYWANKNKDLDVDMVATDNFLRKYIIRHGVSDLRKESYVFGNLDEDYNMGNNESADDNYIKMLLQADRLLRLCKNLNISDHHNTNDPRYHVGLGMLKDNLKKIRDFCDENGKQNLLIEKYCHDIEKNEWMKSIHPKAFHVANEINEIVKQNEKVLVFCEHHATAAEITTAIVEKLNPKMYTEGEFNPDWKKAWDNIFTNADKRGKIPSSSIPYKEAFIRWMSSQYIIDQIEKWIGYPTNNEKEICKCLKNTYVKNHQDKYQLRIADAALNLFKDLTHKDSKSTIAILRSLAQKGSFGSKMPNTQIVSAIEKNGIPDHLKEGLDEYVYEKDNSDLITKIFNSPFGPDVLVVTDKYSEGIDLHGFCRYLIHYELNTSPIKVMQRNGRIRRVNSWAAKVNEPICIGYPAFIGTRDEKLVKIMAQRIELFDTMLGGVGSKINLDTDELLCDDEMNALKNKNIKNKMNFAIYGD